MENNNLVVIILCGIPCSGKSTWVEQNAQSFLVKYGSYPIVISRDAIREKLFGKNYIQNTKDEVTVTNEFYKQLGKSITLENAIIVLDNCHTRKKYIDGYLTMFRGMHEKGKMKIFVKFFDISLVKALWRNFWRERETGKTVPYSVIKKFHSAYKQINKDDYKHLLYE